MNRPPAVAGWPADALARRVAAGEHVVVSGLGTTALALVLRDLAPTLDRPVVVVTPTMDEGMEVMEALRSFAGPGADLWLPPPDALPWSGMAPDRHITLQRMAVWSRAGALEAGDVMVTTALGWSRRGPSSRLLATVQGRIAEGEELETERFVAALRNGGWSAVALVEDPGTFSVRGDIIDLFPPGAEGPVRIERYGDLVESIRRLDPGTQRSGASVPFVDWGPAHEEILTDATIERARIRLARLAESLRVPSVRVGAVLRDLAARNRYFGIEGILPALEDQLTSLRDRIPEETLVVVVEPERALDALDTAWVEIQRTWELDRDDEGLAFEPSEFFLDRAGMAASFEASLGRVDVHANRGPEGAAPIVFGTVPNHDLVRARKEIGGDEDAGTRAVVEALRSHDDSIGRVAVVCASRGSADRVTRLLGRVGADAVRVEGRLDLSQIVPPPWSQIEVVVGDLRSGFRAPARGVAVVSDRELVARKGRRDGRDVAYEAAAVGSFKDLAVGDLVVHTDFGVARYLGLERIAAGDIANDYLLLEYADGDRLYVPVYRLGRVGRYVGSAQFTRLDKLGGTTWDKTKEKVRRQLADLANDLIRIQAERKTREGFAYSAPDDLYRAFEDAFPFEETPHQAQAIEDVLGDMTSPQPMDRLLCGDVGFGKTEVAIRAAYKAVVDGRQVAVLVPTTVLAEQHLKSFRSRLASTPARVEALSRFRSTKETKQILDDTAAGRVDVLIGTHRLLSKDIGWKDLGLLIIDEEQRFGVAHKEKVKQLRATIDVLTMSATPIPRTLEMSMLGIRDLSVILTPPPGRLAVRTHLAKFRDSVLRDGILSEVRRGGQVYFVHNRVETIHNVADTIRRIVPDVRVEVAHAQMRDTELEDVMMSFLRREAQVLVTTTIIESGIDISTANTIFINEAHRFGLAQLHQLRGRVGRGSERAFCYLLVPDPNRLTPDARRRLDVIQEHSDLGAGLQIAHQDLDIRGAGDVLGRDQAGHVESVGFELFTELLEEAIRDVKGEAQLETFEPEVKVPVGAYLPEDYIDDVGQRLAFYKRFSLAEGEDQLDELVGELEDRYGPAPSPARALRDVVAIKLVLMELRIDRLEASSKRVTLRLRDDTRLAPDRVMDLLEASRGRYEFLPDMTLVRHLKGVAPTAILAEALRAVHEVAACRA